MRHGFILWVEKIPWRRKWLPTAAFLSGEPHGPRSLVGYSSCGRKESDTTKQLHFHFSSCPALCDPVDSSMPGFPVLQHLPEFVHTHVHWVDDAIPPLSSFITLFSSCPQSFPESGSFPMSWLFTSAGQGLKLHHQSFR